jgi:hypothetical protein
MSPPIPSPPTPPDAVPPVAEQKDPKDDDPAAAPTVTAIAVPGVSPVMVSKEKPPPPPLVPAPPPHKRTRTELTPAGTVNVPDLINETITPLPNTPVYGLFIGFVIVGIDIKRFQSKLHYDQR